LDFGGMAPASAGMAGELPRVYDSPVRWSGVGLCWEATRQGI